MLITTGASLLAPVVTYPASALSHPCKEDTIDVVNHMVEIKGFKFSPEQLSVKPGDTITFTNLDIAPHTATASDRTWDTGQITRNESATIKVSEKMTTDYFCIYHPNMKASLTLKT